MPDETKIVTNKKGVVLASTSYTGTIKIRWIRIIKDNGSNRLFYAGTPSGSSNLQGGYFDTNHADFDEWFELLLESFNSTDASPVTVAYTTNGSPRNYTYYEQTSYPAYTPPEYPTYTSINHTITTDIS